MKNSVVKFPEDRERLMLLILSWMLMSLDASIQNANVYEPNLYFWRLFVFATQESSGFVYSFAGTLKSFVTGALIMVIQTFYPSER